jgi:hypothetical protein
MSPVLILWLIGLGSAGLGWLCSHAGDTLDGPSNTSTARTWLARGLYAFGFLAAAFGTAAAFDIASNPAEYGVDFSR